MSARPLHRADPRPRQGSWLLVICLSLPAIAVCGDSLAAQRPSGDESTWTVQLRGGSRIVVTAPDQTMDWETVAQDGSTSDQRMALSQIRFLAFAQQPASKQVAQVRRWVAQLASSDYAQRRAAEQRLTERGAPFTSIISTAIDHPQPEVRYRARRILKTLEQTARGGNQVRLEFDRLQNDSGTWLEGDVVDWSLQCRWEGAALTLGRKAVRSLQRGPIARPEPPAAAPRFDLRPLVTDDLFFDAEGRLRDPFVQVDFDYGPNRERLIADKDLPIDTFFAFRGALLACEMKGGHVAIAPFEFKGSRSRRRSAGNVLVDADSGKQVSYKGEMRISFCDPGRPNVPATVHDVGMFLEIVLPRHTVLEAYNTAGHLVGSVQAVQDRSAFAGLRTTADVAYLRVRANRELDVQKLGQELNEDFAIDDLVFSPPQVALDLNRLPTPVAILKDGQRIQASQVRMDADRLTLRQCAVDDADHALPWDRVRCYLGPERPPAPPADGLFVMLTDGSVIHCQSAQPMRTSGSEGWALVDADPVGLWGARRLARYPLPGDFNSDGQVMVLPNVRLGSCRVRYDELGTVVVVDVAAAERIEQALMPEAATGDGMQTGPAELAEGEQRFALADAPPLWFGLPTTPAPELGVLRTYDGQQFVFGGDAGFRLASIGPEGVTLARETNSIFVPLDNLRMLAFPYAQ